MLEKIGWLVLTGCTALVVHDAASRNYVVTSIYHQCAMESRNPKDRRVCADQELTKLIKLDIGWSLDPVTGELREPS